MPNPDPRARPTAESVAARNRRDRALLAAYARDPSQANRDRIVERFMPLARALAYRYSTSSEPIDDLVQVAAEGLVRAVEGYDLSRGNAFSSYATPVIVGGLRHYFRDCTHSIHVPRGLSERIQRVEAERVRLEAETGTSPTPAQIAASSRLEEEQVLEALGAAATRRPISIDAPARSLADEIDTPLVEAIGTEEIGFERVEASLAGSSVELTEQEREVLDLRYRLDLTQREIGDRIGVSQMQVSRLLRRALEKLLDGVQGGGVAA